jgi:nucleoid DNA-binding protein
MSKTINKDGIVEFLQTHDAFADATKKSTKEFVEDFVAFIQETVAEGDSVSIAGFGKFEPFERSNGATVPKFRAFKDFKDALAS